MAVVMMLVWNLDCGSLHAVLHRLAARRGLSVLGQSAYSLNGLKTTGRSACPACHSCSVIRDSNWRDQRQFRLSPCNVRWQNLNWDGLFNIAVLWHNLLQLLANHGVRTGIHHTLQFAQVLMEDRPAHQLTRSAEDLLDVCPECTLTGVKKFLVELLALTQTCEHNFDVIFAFPAESNQGTSYIHNLDRFTHFEDHDLSMFANRKRLQHQ